MIADLRLCAVADLEVEAGSVDLILTDPPYPREYLSTWSDLGAFAAHALAPGGSLVAMSGQAYLAEVMARVSEHVKYRWTFACMTPGSNGRFWPLKLWSGWKPIIWWTKDDGPAAPRRWLEDRVVSRPDKKFHVWGQDVGVYMHLALSFSGPNALIADPFLGGGTTGVAAALYRRRFLGCDTDPTCIRKTEARLEAVREYLASGRVLPEPESEADETDVADSV